MRSGWVETGLNRGVQKQVVNPVPTQENESKYKYETYSQPLNTTKMELPSA
jgi:hypothetical protein